MYFIGHAVLLLSACCLVFGSSKYITLEEAFTSFLVVPFVIPVVPSFELSVRFYTEKVKLGNKIPAYAGVNPPAVYYDADPSVLHTIVIVDADPPSALAPLDTQLLQTMLINIPGNNIGQNNYVTPYVPLNPYPGSGYHRYVILLYKQSKRIDENSPYIQNLNANLTDFSITDFAMTYGLGNPIGGNFFLSQLTVCERDEEILNKCVL